MAVLGSDTEEVLKDLSVSIMRSRVFKNTASDGKLRALFTKEVSQNISHTFALSPRQGSDLNIH